MSFRNDAAVFLLLATAAGACATNRQPASVAHIDHVMLGVRDLDEGIAQFQQQTGVTPQRGGSHPGRGTENALVSLGENTYLEIIAPRRDAQTADEFLSHLRNLDKLTPVGWAAGVADAASAREQLTHAGFDVTAPQRGSRTTPTGTTLGWTTFGLNGYESDGVPFFIQWDAATTHPSQSSPRGCTLRTLSVADPNAGAIAKALRAEGLSVPVNASQQTSITLAISCGDRRATFTSQ